MPLPPIRLTLCPPWSPSPPSSRLWQRLAKRWASRLRLPTARPWPPSSFPGLHANVANLPSSGEKKLLEKRKLEWNHIFSRCHSKCSQSTTLLGRQPLQYTTVAVTAVKHFGQLRETPRYDFTHNISFSNTKCCFQEKAKKKIKLDEKVVAALTSTPKSVFSTVQYSTETASTRRSTEGPAD